MQYSTVTGFCLSSIFNLSQRNAITENLLRIELIANNNEALHFSK